MDRLHEDWYGKPYYSLDAYFKNKYGYKCYKIAVDIGCTCPNRDGTLDVGGCIFCSEGGSGDFAEKGCTSVKEQIENGKKQFNKKVGEHYVIYFQAYTNTYGDIDYLEEKYIEALECEEVIGVSIATRPDCLEKDVMLMLARVNQKALSLKKFVWVELGLQTIHKKTVEYINRHYPLAIYDGAVEKLSKSGIPYITHMILGLPGEDRDMMLETVRYVCENVYKPFGIKLQLLHVLKNTRLAKDYENKLFETMSMMEYIDTVIECVKYIDKDIVIHRITGDGPKNILISPKWSGDKKRVMNTLHKCFKEKGIIQGCCASKRVMQMK